MTWFIVGFVLAVLRAIIKGVAASYSNILSLEEGAVMKAIMNQQYLPIIYKNTKTMLQST